MSGGLEWLDASLGAPTIEVDGDDLPKRPKLAITGATVVDNPTEKKTEITFDAAVAAAAGIADLAALRAIGSSSRTHRQRRVVQDQRAGFVFLTDEGAGVSDDDLNVIKPSDVLLASAGRWYREPQVVTQSQHGVMRPSDKKRLDALHVDIVADYGAVGDGTTDNTTAIQDAIDDVSVAGGGRIFVPKGVFNHAGLTITSSSVHIVGIGAGSGNVDGATNTPVSELHHTGTGDALFIDGGVGTIGGTGGPDAVLDSMLADLCLSGQANTDNLLRLRNAHYSVARRVAFKNCSNACVLAEFSLTWTWDHCKYSTNEHVPTPRPDYAWYLGRLTTGPAMFSTTHQFNNCRIEGATIGYYEDYGSQHVWHGGSIQGCQDRAIVLSNSQHSEFTNVDIEANVVGDIDILSGSFGHSFQCLNAFSGSVGGIRVRNGAYFITAVSCQFENIQIDSGAQYVNIIGCNFLGTLTDNGTRNRILGLTGSASLEQNTLPGGLKAVEGPSEFSGGTFTVTGTGTDPVIVNIDSIAENASNQCVLYKLTGASYGEQCGFGLDASDTAFYALGSWYLQGIAPGYADMPFRINPAGGAVALGNASNADILVAQSGAFAALRYNGTKRVEADSTGLGFFAVTPVARASTITQTYATVSRTVNAYTADDESSAYSGVDNTQVGSVYATVADLNALRTAYENLRALSENIAKVLNSVIDDLQAYGLEQ